MPILLQLFFAFIQVGLFSVGGGYAAIPLIQNQIVDVHHLMTLGEFPGSILCTLGCIIPSFCICLALAHFYYKYRNFSGVQTVLSALRPAVVALIASAGLSILMLGLFQSDLSSAVLSNFRPLEAVLFVGGLFLLRKYRFNAIAIIFGTGVVGTIAYSLMGAIA